MSAGLSFQDLGEDTRSGNSLSRRFIEDEHSPGADDGQWL